MISGLSTVMEVIGRFPILIFLSLSLNRFSWGAIPIMFCRRSHFDQEDLQERGNDIFCKAGK